MRVQVKKGGMISLPRQAMKAHGIMEQDFLEWSLTQSGILFTKISLADSLAESKKNGDTDSMFWQIQSLPTRKVSSNKK